MNRTMRAAVVFLLRAYKWALSPLLPPACRYVPTCSEYAMEAVDRYGIVRVENKIDLASGDGSPIAGYIEHSVGFHVKIAIPGLGVHMHELPPLFHIQSYGLEGRIEHAGVGGE